MPSLAAWSSIVTVMVVTTLPLCRSWRRVLMLHFDSVTFHAVGWGGAGHGVEVVVGTGGWAGMTRPVRAASLCCRAMIARMAGA